MWVTAGTQDNYFGRKVAQTGAAGVLEMFSKTGGIPGVDLDPTGEFDHLTWKEAPPPGIEPGTRGV